MRPQRTPRWKRLESEGVAFAPEMGVRLPNPLAFTDYVHLQLHARATLSITAAYTVEHEVLQLRDCDREGA
jgi:hypothetical protein